MRATPLNGDHRRSTASLFAVSRNLYPKGGPHEESIDYNRFDFGTGAIDQGPESKDADHYWRPERPSNYGLARLIAFQEVIVRRRRSRDSTVREVVESSDMRLFYKRC